MEGKQYSDGDIILKVLAGETGWYEILIRRYNHYLYKTGRSYNYSHEDTQDLMQESFIDAYLNLARFEQRASFKTWIIKIMLHNCYHKRHNAGFKYETCQDISERMTPLYTSATDTQNAIMKRELSHVIEKSLAAIPEDYRTVFTLREISGLNVAETAEALSISEANVKVRLNRAKGMLRNEIEKSYSKDEIFEFNLIYCNAVVENVMGRILALQVNHQP